MRFLVQIEAHHALAGREADRHVRDAVGPQLQRVMESGKVKEAGFLTDADARERLAFRHDLIRAAVYEDVPIAVRSRLHLDAARALHASGARPASLLPHVDLAGEAVGPGAVDLLLAVADAVRHSAPAPAVRLYERCLAVLGDDDAGRRDLVLAHLAVPLASIGRTADAERIAHDLLRRPHDPALGRMLREARHHALLRSGRLAARVRAGVSVRLGSDAGRV
jgi:hypothetical protein